MELQKVHLGIAYIRRFWPWFKTLGGCKAVPGRGLLCKRDSCQFQGSPSGRKDFTLIQSARPERGTSGPFSPYGLMEWRSKTKRKSTHLPDEPSKIICQLYKIFRLYKAPPREHNTLRAAC